MKVADYHRQGLRRYVGAPPEGYRPLGTEARRGAHRVAFFGRVADGRLEDVRFTSSRRCRKLLALADLAAERLQGQPFPDFRLDPAELQAFFAEERDQAKMADRADLIAEALGLSRP